MELADLGFDRWFQQKQEQHQITDCVVARITVVNRENYLARNEDGEIRAELSGKLLFTAESSAGLPCVGDWVFAQYHNSNTLAIIHGLLPRKTFLQRKTAGKTVDYQMIASNIDVALIMQSCDTDFNLRRLERYMVMVNEGQIEPIILLSKTDLIATDALDQIISQIRQAHMHPTVIAFSNQTGFGLDAIKNILQKGKTYCLLGSSGVGKTTLLNHLIGRDLFETNTVREKDGRGRHTTARRQLIVLDNGALFIDTPGMRELGMIGVATGITDSFSEIGELSEYCRFSNCTHTTEPGCALLKALEAGDLSDERYSSYLKLLKESNYHQMSYFERRRKDKAFGRMVKSAMKHKKKG